MFSSFFLLFPSDLLLLTRCRRYFYCCTWSLQIRAVTSNLSGRGISSQTNVILKRQK